MRRVVKISEQNTCKTLLLSFDGVRHADVDIIIEEWFNGGGGGCLEQKAPVCF